MGYYPHLNDVYMTERLKQRLTGIGQSAISTVVAPMGYGKTTAVTIWEKQIKKKEPAAVFLRQMIDTPGISDFWNGVCHILRKYPILSEQLAILGFPKDSHTMSMLTEVIEEVLNEGGHRIYYILDDLHVLEESPITAWIVYLSRHLGNRIHFILISRSRIFKEEERLLLGANLYEITIEDLKLGNQEIMEYARYCQLTVSKSELNSLVENSEGWISMIYLNFKAYAQTGRLLSEKDDIYKLIDQVLFAPLPERHQEFLVMIGVTDSFSEEEAVFLWEAPDALKILESLSKNNAFITKNETGKYHCHYMLRQCARQKFRKLSKDRQAVTYNRLGDWLSEHAEYIAAELAYDKAENWDGLMDSLSADSGKTLGGEHQDMVFKWSRECPEEILKNHPSVVLVLMRKLYSFRGIDEMMRLKKLLVDSLLENKNLSEQERNDYLGECEMVMSFLAYNDIAAMSVFHKKACTMLSRNCVSIDPNGTWTFGAPSVAMMFHRTVGNLDVENAQMRECMPFYYQAVGGHGSGSEYVMQGETDFLRGEFSNAKLCYHQAVEAANRKNQYSIRIAAEFLAMRMALFNGKVGELQKIWEQQYGILSANRQYILLNTFDQCQAYIYSLLGHTEDIAPWLRSDSAASMVMYPALPALKTVYNQILLSQGRYEEVIAGKEECITIFERNHAMLGIIYLHIHLAAAFWNLGRSREAEKEMRLALESALPDRLLMPFVENEEAVRELLKKESEKADDRTQIKKIISLSKQYQEGKKKILCEIWKEQEDFGLTPREMEIARLAANRFTTREIAETLCLAEGTVRNQLSKVYEKLDIHGDGKNKRTMLKKLFFAGRL